MRGRKTAANCESCMNYEYDDDYECYVCTQDLDEDEMVRFVQGDFRECPYYQVGDEYRVVRKQMSGDHKFRPFSLSHFWAF